MNWKLWGRGLIAAFISSAANGLAAWSIDPGDFNLATGAAKVGKLAVVSGLIGAALYLKTHPTPWSADVVNINTVR